jgi:hypothetical protein
MEPPAVLIYDGRRRSFRVVARAVARGLDGVRPVAWGSDAAQAFLRAQFGERPFAFLLVDDEAVHAGGRTVARLLREQGVDDRLAARVERLYGPVSGPLGRLVHGRAPADLEGTYPLTDAARAQLARLRGGVDIPVVEE